MGNVQGGPLSAISSWHHFAFNLTSMSFVEPGRPPWFNPDQGLSVPGCRVRSSSSSISCCRRSSEARRSAYSNGASTWTCVSAEHLIPCCERAPHFAPALDPLRGSAYRSPPHLFRLRCSCLFVSAPPKPCGTLPAGRDRAVRTFRHHISNFSCRCRL